MSGFHGAFATGVASQQGTLTLPDTWFRPPFWDLLMLQLLRPNSSNLPCLCSTFHLEYPLVLSRFYFLWAAPFRTNSGKRNSWEAATPFKISRSDVKCSVCHDACKIDNALQCYVKFSFLRAINLFRPNLRHGYMHPSSRPDGQNTAYSYGFFFSLFFLRFFFFFLVSCDLWSLCGG